MENSIDNVGSSTSSVGSALGFSPSAMLSPNPMPVIPASATISPGPANGTGTRPRPS